MQRRAFLAMAAVACALSCGAVQALAYRAEYRLSTVLGTAFPRGQAGERWAELVRQMVGACAIIYTVCLAGARPE